MGVPLTSYPAFLWLTVLSALLGSFQNGMFATFCLLRAHAMLAERPDGSCLLLNFHPRLRPATCCRHIYIARTPCITADWALATTIKPCFARAFSAETGHFT